MEIRRRSRLIKSDRTKSRWTTSTRIGKLQSFVHKNKYLNNAIEQNHREVKRITKPMMGFKFLYATRNVLAAIEMMHMISKSQMIVAKVVQFSLADKFYPLAT